ncbi:hypothetical protein [Picosynechococcus sp. PCC 11901]
MNIVEIKSGYLMTSPGDRNGIRCAVRFWENQTLLGILSDFFLMADKGPL